MTPMKACRFVTISLLLCIRLSAEEKASKPTEAARTFIPDSLQVPSFTPPAPVERKRLPDIQIDAATTVPSLSGKTLTIQRGAASTLPDLPPPPPPEPVTPPRELTPEDRARLVYQHRHSLDLGATIYDHKVSEVHWTDQETGATYQAVCGFDIGLLAGIGDFVRDGENYSVFLMHSDFDTTEIRRPFRDFLPRIPEIAAGQFLITQGNPEDPDAIARLQIIRDLITSENERLLAYQSARKQQQNDATAWAEAHPPAPRDETFVLRPHRGSRYLANPQPEKKEGAR
ncbi:MAG: hypothetical protein ABIS50_06595 [Luteolibacter sp.]|uniref:hypothetical protein n=1 Tax=Luteolibacter sp. TaxID=1962973 RepID=UPI0032676BD6